MTRGYITEMGQTGAGIKRAAEIDTTKKNLFTTKWAEISAVCPWFFEMRELIAQRPNVIPIGLGHSATGFDQDVMQLALRSDAAASDAVASISDVEDDEGAHQNEQDKQDRDHSTFQTTDEPPIDDPDLPTSEDDDRAPGADVEDHSKSDVDELITEDDEPEVKKPVVKKGPKKSSRKVANPGASITRHAPVPTPAPASSGTQKLSKRTKLTEVADITKNEELTRRQEIELATVRARQSLKVLEVKGRIAEQQEKRLWEEKQAKREERQMKLKMKEKRLDQLHALRMAQMGMGVVATVGRKAEVDFEF
ncbi:hypothetical protein C8F04DRAFT_1198739 [Mycena alexandri]|uniref:Uncharacterized protein n=1 Tax=Mycena alexandri TaxID=1745969 RepID=A0AAD6S0W8_9AGAR|nr:hypothetical protein C8F04DRAFT_1198739 [Mycena alexandri]